MCRAAGAGPDGAQVNRDEFSYLADTHKPIETGCHKCGGRGEECHGCRCDACPKKEKCPREDCGGA